MGRGGLRRLCGVNLFQSFKLTDHPAFNVTASLPRCIMLMVVGGLQTAINYGIMGFTPSLADPHFGFLHGRGRRAVRFPCPRCSQWLAR